MYVWIFFVYPLEKYRFTLNQGLVIINIIIIIIVIIIIIDIEWYFVKLKVKYYIKFVKSLNWQCRLYWS